MRRYGRPREIVTDRLPSYGPALKELGAEALQSSGRGLNNRAETSHLPLRRRERAMLRFRRTQSLRTFAAIFASGAVPETLTQYRPRQSRLSIRPE